MAYKILVLVALSAALVKAESDCNCEKNAEGEEKELWKFLTALSEDYPEPEDKEISSVIPGVLSPLLECNCLEKSRRKRKIFPEVEEKQAPKKVVERHVFNPTAHYMDRHCPSGYLRIGIMCLPADYID